ncbi:protein O-linked-mannose beta-1,4-N-acetylglucosaminyltransferase 2-like [Canna indica]|uniref:Protein O-linked-mannose beta-1,4-N-acetylglucosaminyltransferase 2-like n=1 Tax=Canna indica TaxID=4628 RepID=A0AAQ3K398_9LILI|nr:protein O-linked-mannose beta-1,4-N-acetylglucosaminyltransferase 2-like [Canna indica]
MKSLNPTRKISNLLVAAAIVLSLCILSLIKARYCSSPYANPQEALEQAKPKYASERDGGDQRNTSASQEITVVKNANNSICSETSKRSNVCEAEGDIRIRGSSQTIFLPHSLTDQEWKTKPYCRKHDPPAMENVTLWIIKPFSGKAPPPPCTVKSAVPALVFSVGGYTDNLFHSFTDVIVPLFISSYQFHGEVQFILSDVQQWWMDLFVLIFKQLSKYEIINASSDEEQSTVRCFPRVIVGLRFHKELGVNASKTPTGFSMAEFKAVLRRTYGLERATVAEPPPGEKPRLLIISRNETRVFLNEKEMTDMAAGLGFEVRTAEANRSTNLGVFARLVNSADVMMGVHGAGLTNMVFLPAGAVVIQVVPITGLDWLARDTFGKPSAGMELKYLEYQISEEESSLSELYPKDHPVLRDPSSITKQGWKVISKTYLDNQDVRPDLGRLRNTLLEALSLLPNGGKEKEAAN